MPDGVDVARLPRTVRAELRGLPAELAERVAAHLVAAGELIDTDPAQAHRHAEAARRRAARLPVVREAAAETAYAAGEWAAALNEYRTLRRMTGNHDCLPVMADCERALGRPQNALRLARGADGLDLDAGVRVEMVIVEAGARSDLGQRDEARRLLGRALDQIRSVERVGRQPVARLRYALAEELLAADQTDAAREMFDSAARLDTDQETDAQLRVDELDGLRIDFDAEDPDSDEPETDRSDRDEPAESRRRTGEPGAQTSRRRP